MKIGDLVKYKRCGTLGIISKIREHTHSTFDRTIWQADKRHIKYKKVLMYEVLWSDGAISDHGSSKLEVVNESR